MRNSLLSLCLLFFFLISLPVHAAEVQELYGVAVVEVETLNVRKGPSKDYDKLGTLSKDIKVAVKGIVEPDWYLIDFEGEDGYINSEYVIFTPQDVKEGENVFITKKYLVMALVVAILILSGLMIYTFLNIRREEEIPVSIHEDTNMHLGEVTYDTYRIDIDPKYFEHTAAIPQPESILEEERDSIWKSDLYGGEVGEEYKLKENWTSEAEIQKLDSKLEQASAQIAALQKEVDALKKQ